MEIDYYGEDFCKDDLYEVNNLDELESMENDLQQEIWNSEERIEIYGMNMGIIQNKIDEVEK